MSEERRHNGDQDEPLRDAFQNWDAGEPADQWEELDEALSLESVWGRIDQTIVDQTNTVDVELRSAFEAWEPEMEADGWNRIDHAVPSPENAMDAEIRGAYDSWEPQQATDGWNKLNDALSIEQVWMGLQHELELPVTTRIPFVKLIAATIAMLFMVSSLYDTPVEQQRDAYLTLPDQQTETSGFAGNDGETTHTTTPHNDLLAEERNQHQQRIAPVQFPIDPVNQLQVQQDLQQQQSNNNNTAQNNEIRPQDNPSVPVVNAEDQEEEWLASVDPLGLKGLNTSEQSLLAQHFIVPQRFSPWTIQVGTQLSSLRENTQTRFTTFKPRFGVAADISFRHRVGPVQLIHAFGVSQYSQDVGKYNNGRYANTRQHINSLQLSSCVGYNYRRFTFYGGLLFSNVLNGLEQNSVKTVTKVYDFEAIQLGMTGGVDVRVLALPSIGKQISVGVQYQWIPNLEGAQAAFEHIHGIRIQTKFSF